MYSGQIPANNAAGTEKSELYVIEPPEPVSTDPYYCSSTFLLDPLYDMIKEKGAYGIINVYNKEACVAWVKGSHLEIERRLTSGIHSKHNAGGQSQPRFECLIEEGGLRPSDVLVKPQMKYCSTFPIWKVFLLAAQGWQRTVLLNVAIWITVSRKRLLILSMSGIPGMKVSGKL